MSRYYTKLQSGTRRFIVVSLLVGLLTGTTGCGASTLTNSFDSPEAIATAVLDALEAEDRDRLLELMVTREEHSELLWEQLPESHHLTFDYARQLNERNSSKAVGEAISRFGGNQFELMSVEFTETSEEYDGFTLHFGTRLNVRRVSDAVEGTLPILDVVLEYGGRWKLMNYDE